MICPSCGSDNVMKNGTTRRGKQNYKCRDCGRQFVDPPQWKPVDPDTKATLDRLLLERVPLAGIARLLQVGEAWLQRYVNRRLSAVPRKAKVQPKDPEPIALQRDELWSFVDHKGQKQWVWLVMDGTTREIGCCWVGDRPSQSAAALWRSLPGVYRQCAVIYTAEWEAYAAVLPSKRHFRVSKQSGLTSYIERFNNTLRQRVSRLVRKALSFSRKVENPIGAIWYFIHHYNESIRLESCRC
ncbi:MAG: IS1 family transposase [Elainella sp.]